jgi:hypothetical protein
MYIGHVIMLRGEHRKPWKNPWELNHELELKWREYDTSEEGEGDQKEKKEWISENELGWWFTVLRTQGASVTLLNEHLENVFCLPGTGLGTIGEREEEGRSSWRTYQPLLGKQINDVGISFLLVTVLIQVPFLTFKDQNCFLWLPIFTDWHLHW